MEVDVEVLDVNDDDARALLLTIDPRAALAQTQEQLRDRLLLWTPVSDADLQAAWEAAANPALAALAALGAAAGDREVPAQWLVLLTCRDERQHVELLDRFRREGVECRALVSKRRVPCSATPVPSSCIGRRPVPQCRGLSASGRR